MISKMVKWGKKYYLKQNAKIVERKENSSSLKYFANGQIPWSEGYQAHRKNAVIDSISNSKNLNNFSQKQISKNYGYRLDERIVEYPWIFCCLAGEKAGAKILDAGSTFNFDYILHHPIIKRNSLTIFTFFPEKVNYNKDRISYVYGDLRDLPFKDDFFEIIVCQSTLEHIDMDNSMYGYELKSTIDTVFKKSYEYLKVIKELVRVLRTKGQLLLTFPYGKFENHGFFQQLDNEMVQRITTIMNEVGNYELFFFKYLPEGWVLSSQTECEEAESFNPHTQKGKKDDFAAHSRAICCIKLIKK